MACQYRRHKRREFDPWVRKIPWRRAWRPTPVFLLGESHGQRSPADYSLYGHKASDKTERLNPHAHSNMGGLGGHHAEGNESDRERQMLYGITYMWKQKKKDNKLVNKTKKKLADSEKKQSWLVQRAGLDDETALTRLV